MRDCVGVSDMNMFHSRSDRHIVQLSDSQTVELLDSQTLRLVEYQTVRLSETVRESQGLFD